MTNVIGWYIGVGLAMFIAVRLVRQGWARRLPYFFAYILVVVGMNLALMATTGTPTYGLIYKYTSIVGLVASLAASIEAFQWCSTELPNFRRLGYYLMLLCAGISLALQHWTKEASTLGAWMQWIAELERGAGFFLFFFLAISLVAYSWFERISMDARHHSACLATASLANAVGWKMMQLGVDQDRAATVIVWGTALAWAGWLLLVDSVPTGTPPKARSYDAAGVGNAWDKADDSIRRAAGGR